MREITNLEVELVGGTSGKGGGGKGRGSKGKSAGAPYANAYGKGGKPGKGGKGHGKDYYYR